MSDTVEVVVGVIGRAHGLRGDLIIEVRTDEAERRFAKGVVLTTDQGQQLPVARAAWRRGCLHVAFEGHLDRTAAEALRGQVLSLQVPVDERPSEPEEFFDRQLIGLTVVRADGEPVGVVTQVEHLPSQDLLIVDIDGQSRMIPFVNDLVPKVDLDAGTLHIAEVKGLLEDLE